MDGEKGVTGSIVDDLHSWDIKGDYMEGGSSVSGSIIYDIHSTDIQRDQMEGESMVLLQGSSMNFILGISNEIKWKEKGVLLEVSLMKLILRI